ncbi:uncharacterized protein LOC117575195 isoform X1 [Drosophila albomicans]|uniref:Uncharacterized protein LOC117575195 isoform X1 n=2 Tax=Drosophila albomicans TaxID=7291 RepID=A0A6P8XFN5_DROAB|nr:uncharacterized protein LOC117575195 isoform X1 [Drosophila albomicans]
MLKKLSIFFMLLIFEVNAQCVIEREYLRSSNRVFTIKTGNDFKMLRTNVVPVGTTLRIFCSPNNFVDTTCTRSQASSTMMQANKKQKANNGQATVFYPALQRQSCDGASNAECDPEADEFDTELPNVKTKKIFRSSHKEIKDDSCPAPAKMFLVGFKLNEDQFLEVYRTCYDQSSQTALFSIHEIEPKSEIAPRTGDWAKTNVVITKRVWKPEEIYLTFKSLLGNDQSYVQDPKTIIKGIKYVFARGHLAPSADFVFCSEKRASFKLFNAVPQYATVNGGNWLHSVEKWVRESTLLYGKLKVCTGGLGVLQLEHSVTSTMTDIYLGTNERTPIPKWTYKIIKSYTHPKFHFAVVTLNSVSDVTVTSPCPYRPPRFCRGLKIDNTVLESGQTFCCRATDFIEEHVSHLRGVC